MSDVRKESFGHQRAQPASRNGVSSWPRCPAISVATILWHLLALWKLGIAFHSYLRLIQLLPSACACAPTQPMPDEVHKASPLASSIPPRIHFPSFPRNFNQKSKLHNDEYFLSLYPFHYLCVRKE